MTRTHARLASLSLAALAAGCFGEVVDDDALTAGSNAQLTSGEITLVRQGSGKCLDVNAAGTANGTKLQQWTCNGTAAQTFELEDRGGGIYRLYHGNADKCVALVGGATGDGTQLEIRSCSSSSNQKFRVEELGSGTVRLVSTKSGKCVDVSGSSNADGAKVQLWTCNGTNAQAWTLKTDTSGGDDTEGDGDTGGGELTWRRANLTNFTSYPEPGSDECDNYNGCLWSGQFAFVNGQQSESWVASHNIVAVHEKDADAYQLKTLRLRQNGREIDVTVYDMCADRDCTGCCTTNSRETGFLIDIESYTMERFGAGDGIVEWACLDC